MSFCATAISAAKTAVKCAHPGDHRQRRRRSAGQRAGLHQRIDARDQINAGGHHGRRVNQRGDRRGAFHRIRQPDVQRKLAALARRSGKDQQANRARGRQSQAPQAAPAIRPAQRLNRTRAVVVKEQRAGLREEPDNSEQKENIADARGEKAFFAAAPPRASDTRSRSISKR
jgi:hypothetical protein